MNLKKIKQNKFLKIIFFLILPFLIEILLEDKIQFDKAMIIRIGFCYAIYFAIAIFYTLKKQKDKIDQILNFIIKYRYQIAGVIFVLLVIFKINFSSLDQWSGFVGETDKNITIIGKSRQIRSDEWLVQTPFMLGQTLKGEFGIHNENIAQGNLNMIMAQAPVMDITLISRPLTWGFVFLGVEYGFAFYWAFKVVALLLVSLELALKVTKKDKLLGITGALILGLAPAMMWWLSTAIADGFIFGGAVILLFSYYMENINWQIWKKILIAIGIVICLPAFAMTLYPAFQVPFAYVMALFMIIDLWRHRKELKKADYIIMASTIFLVGIILTRFILVSWNDIQTMLSTVYPGARFEQGGDLPIDIFMGHFYNIFLPYSDGIENPCEISFYIYPFIGLITMIIYTITKRDKKEKRDGLLYGLIGLFFIFLFWELVGFNKILAQITFLYFSPTERTLIVSGLIATLLMLILIKKWQNKQPFTKSQALIISILTTIISYAVIKQFEEVEFFTPIKLEIWFVIIFTMTYCLLTVNKKAFCYTMCIIAIVAGIAVNPICRNVDILYETSISKEIQKVHNEDKEALWIGNNNLAGQYLIANGVKALNGINSYPNFEWLNKVDPEGKYNEIYNRYAHIFIDLGEETNFELMGQDVYKATLTSSNIKDLGIKYYLTNQEYNEELKEEFNIKEVYENKEKLQYIYKFEN